MKCAPSKHLLRVWSSHRIPSLQPSAPAPSGQLHQQSIISQQVRPELTRNKIYRVLQCVTFSFGCVYSSAADEDGSAFRPGDRRQPSPALCGTYNSPASRPASDELYTPASVLAACAADLVRTWCDQRCYPGHRCRTQCCGIPDAQSYLASLAMAAMRKPV